MSAVQLDWERKPEYYALTPRRSNATVQLPVGQGNDPDALAVALRAFKKTLGRAGVFNEMKSRVSYRKPGDKKRAKSLKARRKVRKAARRAQAFDAREEARGR